jgi:hypothetical protein
MGRWADGRVGRCEGGEMGGEEVGRSRGSVRGWGDGRRGEERRREGERR